MYLKEVLILSLMLGTIFSKRSRHHRDSVTPAPSIWTSPPSIALNFVESEEDESLVLENPCLIKYCGKGKECVLNRGEAQCICVRRCRQHQKIVCGSDGQRYANHCELHRTACLEEKDITADHTFSCIRKEMDNSVADGPDHRSSFIESFTRPRKQGRSRDLMDIPDVDSTEYNDAETDEENELKGDSCTSQQYEIMKDNLLLYNHAKLLAEDNRSSGKEYLVSIMFSHFDQNNDGALEKNELNQIAEREHLKQLAKGCTLGHLIQFDDADKDGRLNINEFYTAFSKLYSVSVVSLDKSLEVNHLSARVGDNVEIKCDVTGTPPPPIVWKRNDADLGVINEDQVRVFGDGSLYLNRIQLIHAGNYTCSAQRNRDVIQTHILTVHTVPDVKVTPRIQSKRPGEEATMFCHVIGEPFPRVEWLKNDEPLKLDLPNKYEIVGNGSTLQIKNIVYADTGAYMCQATNIGGMTRDISSLIVQEEPTPTSPNEERRFFSFHDWGVSVYEPVACKLYHQIQSTDIIPGTQEYVCGDKGVNCSWGQAINVANRYVYVAQPRKDRVLVISKIQMVVVDVVVTDKFPVELHYVPHLDQVWVLNWRAESSEGIKTIQIIRDAAQKRTHHTVHPEPIDGQFDLVKGLFVPPIRDMTSIFRYGYVTHTNQRGIFKLDLGNMRYVRSIDLTTNRCVPKHLQYSALYGFVIIECEEPITGRPSGQIVLDYLTDTVVSHKTGLYGRPHVSPDSRIVVTLDRGRTGVTLVVQEIIQSGLKFLFDVKTTLNISDITFYPSQTTHGYDLYASATDKEDILFLNLVTGKVEMITGVGKAMHPSLAEWGSPNRPIRDSGVFGRYMVTPASEALFVINGETRTVNCEIGGVAHPREAVWVTMHLQ